MNRFLPQLSFIIAALLLTAAATMANDIAGFSVQESLEEGETIELIALDASGNRLEKLSGDVPFSINGFETDLKFRGGRAFFPSEVAASTFIYLKYKGGDGNAGNITRLYYVYQGLAGGFTVMHIPLLLLVVVPLGLILLGMIFRKLIIFALILLAAFFYFNNTKGLSPGDFFDAAGEWLSSLLQMIIGA